MDNGPKMDCEKARVSKFGQMVVNMKVIGKMTKPMDMGALFILTVTVTKDNS